MRGPVDALHEDRTGRKPGTPHAADASHDTLDSRMSPTPVLRSSTVNDDVEYCSETFASWERPRCHSFISNLLREIFDCYLLSTS
jgi:hypothetical protein